MKKIFLIISLLSISVFSQETANNDSVDIRSLVSEQINKIKENETMSATIKTAEVVAVPKKNEFKKTEIKDYTNYAIFFAVEIGLAVSLIFLWIKRKKINNKHAVKYLKLNIAKLRKERIGTRFNNDLTKLRSKLAAQPIRVNDHGRDITYKAKKYSISKGEVHLAAKLKMLAEKSR